MSFEKAALSLKVSYLIYSAHLISFSMVSCLCVCVYLCVYAFLGSVPATKARSVTFQRDLHLPPSYVPIHIFCKYCQCIRI